MTCRRGNSMGEDSYPPALLLLSVCLPGLGFGFTGDAPATGKRVSFKIMARYDYK